jgi:predicted transcriptional regulator
MSDSLTVKISPRARSLAEENSAREGFSSVDDYVDALILEDSFEDLVHEQWLQKKIEEGLASPVAGELTRERLRLLVEEGIVLAERDRASRRGQSSNKI